jgi:uncharacterized membrane protein YedE/YeeE
MRQGISSYFAGLLFGVGLIVSGMADPVNVVGFFDLFGTWNPTLALVMAGGLSVTFLGYRYCLKRSGPLCAASYQLPGGTRIDARLITGSAIFGLGWGLAGYCPGPAFVAAAGGLVEAAAFASSMLGGMLAWRMVELARDQRVRA